MSYLWFTKVWFFFLLCCKWASTDEVSEPVWMCVCFWRHGCRFGHQLLSEHNARILRAHHMIRLSREDLRVMLLQSDSSLLPPVRAGHMFRWLLQNQSPLMCFWLPSQVCAMFNRGRGPHGSCPDGERCTRLHVCVNFVRGRCDGADCGRSHDFHEPHPKKVLYSRGVSRQLMDSLPVIYRNILALKTPAERRNTEPVRSRRIVPETNAGVLHSGTGFISKATRIFASYSAFFSSAENEICLSFVRGFCGDGTCVIMSLGGC